MMLDEGSAEFDSARLRNNLDATLAKATTDGPIVGSVVLVAVGGRRVYQGAAGFADREAKTPMEPATLFRWASLTKPIVSVATLALAEKGVVSLDDPVTKFLPDFHPRLANGETPVIRLRHLLTHTSGLTYRLMQGEGGSYAKANISDGLDQPGLSIDENLRRLGSVPLAFAPGAGWGYSLALDVTGALIARAAGEPLPALLKRLVFDPLGMTDTGFVVENRSRLAAAYGDGSPTPVRMGERAEVAFGEGAISFAPDRMFDAQSYPSGGAGLSGPAEDFLVFLQAMRRGGAPILSPPSIDLLARIATGDFPLYVPGWGFSHGWSVLRDPAATGTPQSPGTWRWGGVYGNSWFVDPALQLSVVALTNTAIAGMVGPFPDAIRDAIYAARK
jgi:CubicO group peptidase (beta-lactamase class C family)